MVVIGINAGACLLAKLCKSTFCSRGDAEKTQRRSAFLSAMALLGASASPERSGGTVAGQRIK